VHLMAGDLQFRRAGQRSQWWADLPFDAVEGPSPRWRAGHGHLTPRCSWAGRARGRNRW
jgi:hypothetical protein